MIEIIYVFLCSCCWKDKYNSIHWGNAFQVQSRFKSFTSYSGRSSDLTEADLRFAMRVPCVMTADSNPWILLLRLSCDKQKLSKREHQKWAPTCVRKRIPPSQVLHFRLQTMHEWRVTWRGRKKADYSKLKQFTILTSAQGGKSEHNHKSHIINISK